MTLIDPSAKLGNNVHIGPYAIIEKNVVFLLYQKLGAFSIVYIFNFKI